MFHPAHKSGLNDVKVCAFTLIYNYLNQFYSAAAILPQALIVS
jgi:hypothetical protein